MAITINQSPQDWAAINDIILVNALSDNVGEAKFKYHFVVKVNTATVFEGLIPANNADAGMLDLSKILREYCYVDTESLSDSGFIALTNNTSKPYTRSTNSVILVGVEVGESYAVTANDPATEYPNLDDVEFYALPVTKQVKDGFHSALDRGLMTSTSSKFLQDTIEVDSTNEKLFLTNKDRYILSFINDNADSQVDYIEYQLFDQGGSITPTVTITNDIASGGVPPVLATLTASKVVHLRCGVVDLNDYLSFPNRPSDYVDDWTYYTLCAKNTAGTQIGKTYTIYRREYDCRFDSYQLMYKNTDGFWNFQTFGMKSERTVKTKGKTYNKLIGSWNSVSFTFNTYDRRTVEYHKQAYEEMSLVSDWIEEAEAEIFKQAPKSNAYYLIKNGEEVIPCKLLTSSYKIETRSAEKPIQISIKVMLDEENTV